MSINLSNAKKKDATLNNELFFNYSNKIEKNVSFEISNDILEVKLHDLHCTAKFGNVKDTTMNINTIKIVKGGVNGYENKPDGECILTYIPTQDTLNGCGQVCIKLKGLEPDDPRINKFFANMLDGENLNESNTTINLDHLIPNGSKFFYAKTESSAVLNIVRGASSVVLFDDYNTVYCPTKLLDLLGEKSPSTSSINATININQDGSVNDNEEFITECTPIGADVNTEDWEKPGHANTIFSFFVDKKANQLAWKKISNFELFKFGDDYTDEEGNKGGDFFVYIIFHFVILIFVVIILLMVANLFAPGEYYKEGVKVGIAQTLGTEK
tara:strand:+ start:2303 stop:3283 length:981 start_codon:yes stop_codon:yes gene_type:complete